MPHLKEFPNSIEMFKFVNLVSKLMGSLLPVLHDIEPVKIHRRVDTYRVFYCEALPSASAEICSFWKQCMSAILEDNTRTVGNMTEMQTWTLVLDLVRERNCQPWKKEVLCATERFFAPSEKVKKSLLATIHVQNFQKVSRADKRDGLFTDTGLFGTVKANIYDYIDMIGFFIAEAVYRCCEWSRYPWKMRTVHIFARTKTCITMENFLAGLLRILLTSWEKSEIFGMSPFMFLRRITSGTCSLVRDTHRILSRLIWKTWTKTRTFFMQQYLRFCTDIL